MLNTLLTGKHILLFIPNGKGNYGSQVYNEIIERGGTVDIYDERPSASTFSKAAFRMASTQLNLFFLNYVNKIVSLNQTKAYDYVIIIRGELFSPAAMKVLKSQYPTARFILYLWDSVRNTNTSEIFGFFDKVLSFDRKDSTAYGLVFRPLFFINAYEMARDCNKQDIDVLFIGSVHSDRYTLVKQCLGSISNTNFTSFTYYYLPSRLLYYKMKCMSQALKGSVISEFVFKPMAYASAAGYMGRCKSSIDAEHPSQTGLTMRTIETLGAERKLFTTNRDIVNYDFYNPENIQVINRGNPKLDLDFINAPYQKLPPAMYEYYSIRTWFNELVST